MPIFAHIEFRCKRVEGVPDDVKAFLENKKFDAVVRGPHWPAGGEEADVGEGEAQYYGDVYCCDNAHGTSFTFYRRPFDPVFELGEDEEPLGYADFDRPFKPTTRKECLGTLVKVLLDDIPPAASYEIGSAYSARGEGWKYEGEDFPAWWLRAPAEV